MSKSKMILRTRFIDRACHWTVAIVIIHAILIHIYMAFWVKGSIKGMIEGKVSRRRAKKHHPRWYREVEATEEEAKK